MEKWLPRLALAILIMGVLAAIAGVATVIVRKPKVPERPPGVELPECAKGTHLVESDMPFDSGFERIMLRMVPQTREMREALSTGKYYAFCVQDAPPFKDLVQQQPKHGPFRGWYLSGQIAESGEYSKDEIEGDWREWHENGNLSEESRWRQGDKEGPYRTYFSNGQISHECDHLNGNHTGRWLDYYENGQIKKEGQYSNGKEVGLWREWSESGVLIEETDHGGVPDSPTPNPQPSAPNPAP